MATPLTTRCTRPGTRPPTSTCWWCWPAWRCWSTPAGTRGRSCEYLHCPPTGEVPSEPNFYDSMKKIRLRQQLEMYSIARKFDQHQPQKQNDSVQLSME